MKSRKLHLVVAVVGITLAATFAWWWQHRDVAAGPAAPQAGLAAEPGPGRVPGEPPGVEVGRVTAMRLQDEANAVGSLRSRQSIVVRPEVAGRVVQLGFRDGQAVRRGQLLLQLDDTLQRAQVQQARAEAAISRTNLKRNRELVAQNFVSQSAVDQSAAALEVAEAQVALAQAQLGRMRVLAPFDGMTGIRQVDIGDFVQSGADIVNLEDTGAMLVDFRLPERVLARLKPGQAVEVALDGLPGHSYPGRIDAVDAQVDANGRSLLVRARLENPQGALRPGMFARTRIVFSTRERALMVPEEALVPQGGKQYLLKIVDSPNGPVSRRLEARIGLRVPGRVEILEGLTEGDRVAIAGQGALLAADGQRVRIVELDGAGAGTPDPEQGDRSGVTAPGPGTSEEGGAPAIGAGPGLGAAVVAPPRRAATPGV